MSYVELQVTSSFSFLRGASHPPELVEQAAALGHKAAAIADRNSLAGVVRAHQAAETLGIRLVVGTRLVLEDASEFLVFPIDRAAYARLTTLLTLGKRRAGKGACRLGFEDLVAAGEGQIVIALPPEAPDEAFRRRLFALREAFGDRAYCAAQHLYRGDDAKRIHRLAALSPLPLVATNDVLYHIPERRPLQDVVTCIREGCTIENAGWRLLANAERHLKSPEEMARLFRLWPDAIARSVEIAERCRFSLKELCYQYPDETADGLTPQARLEKLVQEGLAWRYPGGAPEPIRRKIEHELQLIGQLHYAPYFLTVRDIMRFAESRGILCQGRGSAANSVVCYCLGITPVDPAIIDGLFERFVSAARNEPPDIDIDFEHERREEVIQHIYEKYGRHRAAMTATVACYRTRGALRDVGKVFGLSEDVTSRLASGVWGWGTERLVDDSVRELGLDPSERTLRQVLDFSAQLVGLPRHLGQHVGGFVITRGPLHELVPIENASMEDRTFIEWDKDDIDALRILKVDVLGLGMLTAIRKAFDLIGRHYGERLTLATIPPEEPAVYEMLGRADSIGVFQVESRAQMTMLPRLKPEKFYDLVIEVAIVRPGPIQGNMVHPYLRRRTRQEEVVYPSQDLETVLSKTLGVPLFQEQAMQIAIVAAGFTPEESDQLRRAMATFKRNGQISTFRDKFIEGMVRNRYTRDFATRCFEQIEGFSTYGFPESHAASFAILVYASAWIKHHYPEVFAAALLNAQPMGFYAPAQLVRDARDHGVTVLPPDVNRSDWDCTLEVGGRTHSPSSPRGEGWGEGVRVARSAVAHRAPPLPPIADAMGPSLSPGGRGNQKRRGNRFALRLGLRQIKGFREADAVRLKERRGEGYATPAALWHRAGLEARALELLAAADAFRSMGLDRRHALWAVKALGEPPPPLLAAAMKGEAPAPLPAMREGEHVAEDYATLLLTLRRHPVSFLRQDLAARRFVCARDLANAPAESRIDVAGLVLIRQRPDTASGVIFMTIEDETGVANLVVWPAMFERFRPIVLGATLVACRGRVQREGIVVHVVVERLVDLSHRLKELRTGKSPPAEAGRRDPRHPGPAKPRYPAARDLAVVSRDFR